MNSAAIASGALEEVEGVDWLQNHLRGAFSTNTEKMAGHEEQHELPEDDSRRSQQSETLGRSDNDVGMNGELKDGQAPTEVNTQVETTTTSPARTRGATRVQPQKVVKPTWNIYSHAEEDALHEALQTVGPMWNVIIQRFGKNGTLNDTLKDRDATSLYNKAINIKRKLENHGEEVPAYLENIFASKKSSRKRSKRDVDGASSGVHKGRPARRVKRRQPYTEPSTSDEEGKDKTVVKKEILEISDESDNDDKFHTWQALPSSTPNPNAVRRQPQTASLSKTDMDVRRMKLELIKVEADQRRAQLEIDLYEATKKGQQRGR